MWNKINIKNIKSEELHMKRKIDENKIDYYWSIDMTDRFLKMGLLTYKQAEYLKDYFKNVYKQNVI
jgi:hypothetical protein